jgi:hypothetical protein
MKSGKASDEPLPADDSHRTALAAGHGKGKF